MNLNSQFMNVLNEVPNFVTDETASAGKRTYKYLNLATVLKTIKPIFAKHGIGFTQNVRFETATDKSLIGVVETVIFNEDEEKTVGAYPFVATADPQANGSAVTYARRYALYAVLGIFPDKDDDGAAMRDYASRPEMLTAAQAGQLTALAKQAGVNLLDMASQVHGSPVRRLRELTAEEGANISATLVQMGRA